MNIQEILDDCKSERYTHGEIKRKHGLTDPEEFAIAACSNGLTIQEIQQRLPKLRLDDTAKQIRAKMQTGQ